MNESSWRSSYLIASSFLVIVENIKVPIRANSNQLSVSQLWPATWFEQLAWGLCRPCPSQPFTWLPVWSYTTVYISRNRKRWRRRRQRIKSLRLEANLGPIGFLGDSWTIHDKRDLESGTNSISRFIIIHFVAWTHAKSNNIFRSNIVCHPIAFGWLADWPACTFWSLEKVESTSASPRIKTATRTEMEWTQAVGCVMSSLICSWAPKLGRHFGGGWKWPVGNDQAK